MAIFALDHANVRSSDLDATKKFYEKLFGLRVGPRPNFGFPGLWLYAGSRAIIHVNLVSHDEIAGDVNGVFDHVAFSVDDTVEEMSARLTEKGVSYDLRPATTDRPRQMFVKGPSGEMVELVFSPR